MSLLIKILKKNTPVNVPKRQTAGAAGYDLHSTIDCVISAGERVTIETGIVIALPDKTQGEIAPRSGLSKKKIDVCAGVIDSDYRGEIGVMLHNHGSESYAIKAGDRIAQLIIRPILTPEIKVVDELPETVRGASGFGSTGV